ncbi:MAG: hypothetical protein FRX49_13096 [Trebouxia sp. A1-2]|nr:MAG: hypothetical protein FRX49_13096 [Trebouxia sp. A1-2]
MPDVQPSEGLGGSSWGLGRVAVPDGRRHRQHARGILELTQLRAVAGDEAASVRKMMQKLVEKLLASCLGLGVSSLGGGVIWGGGRGKEKRSGGCWAQRSLINADDNQQDSLVGLGLGFGVNPQVTTAAAEPPDDLDCNCSLLDWVLIPSNACELVDASEAVLAVVPASADGWALSPVGVALGAA